MHSLPPHLSHFSLAKFSLGVVQVKSNSIFKIVKLNKTVQELNIKDCCFVLILSFAV